MTYLNLAMHAQVSAWSQTNSFQIPWNGDSVCSLLFVLFSSCEQVHYNLVRADNVMQGYAQCSFPNIVVNL